jgi:SAM-dependent methyltransferase
VNGGVLSGRYLAATVGSGSYTFGDSALAAARLAVLAEVFKEATASFLMRVRDERQQLAVDLGCGPGFTTLLLDEVVTAERVIGVDSSVAFVEEAAQRLGPRAEVLCADVLDLPAEVRDADLIFARFLLTHLAKPIAAIEYWLDRLSPAGVLAIQETESIWTDEPTLTRYLELQRRMLEANGNLLYVGPLIADAGRAHGTVLQDDVVRVTPPPSAAARMFAMNFPSWRTRPPVTELASRLELDEIEQGLRALSADDDSDASITWELREVVVAEPGPTAA